MLTAMVISAIVYKGVLASGGGFSSGTVTTYYIVGIIAVFCGAVLGGWRIYERQKVKWTDEGVSRARQAQVTEENSTQLKENTTAINGLSTKMDAFINTANATMNGMGHRLDRLERYIPPRNKQEDLD